MLIFVANKPTDTQKPFKDSGTLTVKRRKKQIKYNFMKEQDYSCEKREIHILCAISLTLFLKVYSSMLNILEEHWKKL